MSSQPKATTTWQYIQNNIANPAMAAQHIGLGGMSKKEGKKRANAEVENPTEAGPSKKTADGDSFFVSNSPEPAEADNGRTPPQDQRDSSPATIADVIDLTVEPTLETVPTVLTPAQVRVATRFRTQVFPHTENVDIEAGKYAWIVTAKCWVLERYFWPVVREDILDLFKRRKAAVSKDYDF